MEKENKKFIPDLQALRAIDLKVREYASVLTRTKDEDHHRQIQAEIDKLIDERARLLGLPDEEIARINQESDAAVDAQIEAEIERVLKRRHKR